MSDTKDRNRKLAMLGSLGLGLALLGRKRRWRRYAMGRMMMGPGFGGYGRWSRFGGYGPWGHGEQQQGFTLPPFIEATLKAWHDREHVKAQPAAPGAEPAGPAQV